MSGVGFGVRRWALVGELGRDNRPRSGSVVALTVAEILSHYQEAAQQQVQEAEQQAEQAQQQVQELNNGLSRVSSLNIAAHLRKRS